MTLDEIIDEWRNDCQLDSTALGAESLKIPVLHSKYMKIYYEERRRLKAIEFQIKDLQLAKHEYYTGKMSEEELRERGWEPFEKILLKSESEMYMQSDKDIIQTNIKTVNQKEKMSLLEEIIKNLNQRNFQIKNAIDYMKLTGGEL
jgi:hypothetical protein